MVSLPVKLTFGCCLIGQKSACEWVSGQNVGKGVCFCEFGAYQQINMSCYKHSSADGGWKQDFEHPSNASDVTLGSYFFVFPQVARTRSLPLFINYLNFSHLSSRSPPARPSHLCIGSLCLNFLFSYLGLHLEHLIKQAQLYQQLLPQSDAAKLIWLSGSWNRWFCLLQVFSSGQLWPYFQRSQRRLMTEPI